MLFFIVKSRRNNGYQRSIWRNLKKILVQIKHLIDTIFS
jgi:hypothetical protein